MATVLDRLVTILDFKGNFGDLDRFERRIDNLKARADSLALGFTAVGTGLAAAAGFSLTAFAEVESKFAVIEGLVGISREQIEAWKPDLERISRETGKSLAELADALFFITSAGFRGEEALNLLEISARASAAGLGEQKTIADLLTAVLVVYAEEGLSAAEATDQLVASIREGKMEPAQLANAMGRLLAPAAELGVEFGEVAGTLAAMSKQNSDVNQNATALLGIFSKMIKPTEAGKKVLAEYGMSVEDVRKIIEEEGLLQALRTLVTLFEGNEEALGKVFEDVSALNGVLMLTNVTAEENAGIIERVSNAHGDLDSALQPVSETLEHKFNQVLAQTNTLIIDMGERLAPMAHQLLDIAKAGLDFYDSLGEGPKDFLATVLALGPILIGIGISFKIISIALGTLLPLIKGISLALGVLLPLFKGVFALLAANPLGAFIAALAAIIIYWDEITAAMVWAWEKFQELLASWGNPQDKIFQWVVDAFFWVIDQIKQLWTGLMQELLDLVPEPIRKFVVKHQQDETEASQFGFDETGGFEESGRAIPTSVAEGIDSAGDEVGAAVERSWRNAWGLFPQSDAKRGPFANLTRSGMALAETFADGIKLGSSALDHALLDAFRHPELLLPVPPPVERFDRLTAEPPQQFANQNQNITIERIEIVADNGDPHVIAGQIGASLRDELRRATESADSVVIA